jgi:hypothetical protein
MNAEDIKWLSSFESNFRTAINSNYSRNVLESQLRKMVDIYEKVTGKKYSLCYHCSTQILYFLKDIGKIYFDAVQKGNESTLSDNELEKTVTVMEGNTKESTTSNTKNNGIKRKRNAKYTTK